MACRHLAWPASSRLAALKRRPISTHTSCATPVFASSWKTPGISARDVGYVETMFGRRLYLPEINASNMQRRQAAERAAINAPMQGTAADIIKRAMISVDDWLQNEYNPADDRAHLLMQVHDELVLEVRKDCIGEVQAKVEELMSAAAELDVPLVVDSGSGSNWDEAH